MNYIVQQGDTISKIARDKLGDITLWEDLARHNKISNPNLIYAGQVLNLDLPKRITIDVTPKESEGATALRFVGGFFLTLLTGIAVNEINEYRKNRKNAKRNER